MQKQASIPADPPPANPPPAEAAADAPADFRALIIELLGLAPDEGSGEISDETISAALRDALGRAAGAGDTAGQLAAVQAELEKIQGEYRALYEREEAARKRQAEAEVDSILEEYAGRIATPESRERLRTILLADREAGIEILKGMHAPASTAPAGDPPPAPMHDPGTGQEPAADPAKKLEEANALIAALRKSKPAVYGTYDLAREEIRRQRPDLFS